MNARNFAAFAILGMIAVSFAAIFWLVLAPINVVDVHYNPIGNAFSIGSGNDSVHVSRGEQLAARISYCKEDFAASTVRAWIEIGDKLEEINSDWAVLPPGCHNSVLTVAPVPPSLSIESTRVGGEGHARLRVAKYFRIRGQTYNYTLFSDYFWIDQ